MRSLIFALLISTSAIGQGLLKNIYEDFLKYGTVYAAGDVNSTYLPPQAVYDAREPYPGALIWNTPEIVDVTEYNPFDFRIGVGIRKLARFDYERKPGQFWTGNQDRERQFALSAPGSAVDGFEYLLHYEIQRLRGETWVNNRYFLRHTGKYHILKVEQRRQGMFDFDYQSAEARMRLPIGKKFSLSMGGIYRTHTTVYGYNPFEIWVQDNIWYAMAYNQGYYDQYYNIDYTDQNGELVDTYDWFWFNSDSVMVAFTDRDFRDHEFSNIINDYNQSVWDSIGGFGLVSPIIGFDYYHYSPKFWLHFYGSWLMPYHRYVQGDIDYSYLNRNNWGKGGLVEGSVLQQWNDFQGGINMGWKLNKSFGIFMEGDYTRFWDKEIFQATIGFNYMFR